ncbi:hypothetical protein SAMN05192529_10345 [Arachidicoccus rhizosphaerae]|jgi:hypothetical protein|uniref:Uncharacterized protein n=1 Tax=Arachidicoccus rhizosphaerae TaxID=551991 RepID=A0A1H3WIX8_9BACT|nr:hypothetical protein SAMN05192529_10345 [Arachidicoccus rhizosphaerae]
MYSQNNLGINILTSGALKWERFNILEDKSVSEVPEGIKMMS